MQFQIETAQNVHFNHHIAGVADRIFAYLLDLLVIISYVVALFYFLNVMDLDRGDSWAFYLILSLPALMYTFLLEALWNGQTIGKYALKTRVVVVDGSSPSVHHFLIRWLLRMIDISLSSGGLALLVILFHGKGQRLGDIAANTMVISYKKRGAPLQKIQIKLAEGYKPVFEQVTRLTDRDMHTVRTLYNKALRKGNHQIILKLYYKLTALLEIKTELKPTEFVKTIIDDYHYYTSRM